MLRQSRPDRELYDGLTTRVEEVTGVRVGVGVAAVLRGVDTAIVQLGTDNLALAGVRATQRAGLIFGAWTVINTVTPVPVKIKMC